MAVSYMTLLSQLVIWSMDYGTMIVNVLVDGKHQEHREIRDDAGNLYSVVMAIKEVMISLLVSSVSKVT